MPTMGRTCPLGPLWARPQVSIDIIMQAVSLRSEQLHHGNAPGVRVQLNGGGGGGNAGRDRATKGAVYLGVFDAA